MEITLIVVAAAFAVFAGVNDGGALLVTSLKIDSVRPLTAALVLTVTVMVAPAVFGTQVATTLANRLVTFRGPEAEIALVLAISGAAVVVVVLAHRRLPTSLTLALVGGIIGVGIGGDLPISWRWAVVVLALAAAAPFVGLLVALGVARMWRRRALQSAVGDQARQGHRVGLVLQAFAYGTNDGQKMLGVLALAVPAGLEGGRVASRAWMLLVVGVLFALGLLLGFRRHGARLSATVRTLTPVDAVTAQLSAAVSVTGLAAVGAPASMTQSLTGALIGSGLSDTSARVRWHHAGAILVAWVLTLPLAVVLVALPALFLVRA